MVGGMADGRRVDKSNAIVQNKSPTDRNKQWILTLKEHSLAN